MAAQVLRYLVAVIAVSVWIAGAAPLNMRPIIGILTQPCLPELVPLGHGPSYIAASYVKHLESAGARVVPIHHNSTTEELIKLARSINGVFFPGGSVYLEDESSRAFMLSARTLLNEVLLANREGEHFPLWGTCLGFEMLMLLEGRDGGENQSAQASLLSRFDASNISLPLHFTPKARASKLFGGLPEDVFTTFSSLPVAMNNHIFGVSPETFLSSPSLCESFTILSTNWDRQGKEFISTVEHVKFPIFGSQWHPEKPIYEWWARESMNHAPESIRANNEMARVFVEHARQNSRKFASEEEEASRLIYASNVYYTASVTPDLLECYIFL